MFLVKKRYASFFNTIYKSTFFYKKLPNEQYGSISSLLCSRRFFGSRNFYDILNVKKSSSKNEIKQAYRKLALKYHPDRNPNNRKESEQKFREITEAYETLSNDNKKSIYDSQLNNGFSSNSFGNNHSNMPNQNMNYNFKTTRMTDEEIENVFKNVFGNMNINDIFNSNIFNENHFKTRTMRSNIFRNFESTESHESGNPNIKQTNIKTEIIPRGNKIIEKTTKIIIYKDGKVKQEVIERDLNNNREFEGIFDYFSNLENNKKNVNNYSIYRSTSNRNINNLAQNKVTKHILNYMFGILSIATRKILVNFTIHLIRKIIQTIIFMFKRR
ncbi:DNAJ like protein, putative [Plasmodium berghei]|uniref:DnaJ protein, putative n=2 Tax=Plasmodium berghei TaxID=5821 RepID=A0A509AR65_PLABA|nr:DnaJ protein, putative [Plasmodium berghei ANKA]CXJ00214.1 DNAJ like protein, putative [Plasmodium berghei]SCL97977.1 DNAJ like protein, putative [Plasmodium berghei]SCM16726.1 DNAJ like protein, putative [Plasmodium berghei]SCM18524.1 DNAJ like protein, putative [Plasmodium berghei]SCN27957.1 DNAJ like protein, putative [Plasmodium berghei]|eukprot:XP_034423610.1 DnaJ protein, putative [Plasmodium berghei ANKA]